MINSFQVKRASESVLNNRNDEINKFEDQSESSSNDRSSSSRSSSEDKKESEEEKLQIKRYFFIDLYSED